MRGRRTGSSLVAEAARPLSHRLVGFAPPLSRFHTRTATSRDHSSWRAIVQHPGAAGVYEFQVWIDDLAVASAPAEGTEIPASWQAPKYTPGIQGGQDVDYLSYSRTGVTPLAFTVVIPPGPRTLKVRYSAEAATHLNGRPTVYRQFAYVLAPARAWSEFGGLDVKIRLPENWRIACTPPLIREGDTLVGSFDDLPADAIALTVQAPQTSEVSARG